MKYNYNLFEDNAGGLHLAILDGETCVYYLCDNNPDFVMSTLSELKRGGDPVADEWEGGEENPQECYKSIVSIVEERNGGAWEIESGNTVMDDLNRAIELQKQFAELYQRGVVLAIWPDSVQLSHEAFCFAFLDGPDRSESAGKYIRHRKKFDGVDIIALEEVR